jgi:hypothetical protein
MTAPLRELEDVGCPHGDVVRVSVADGKVSATGFCIQCGADGVSERESDQVVEVNKVIRASTHPHTAGER